MSSGFSVQLAELQSAASSASALESELSGKMLSASELSGIAGSSDVDAAYSDFVRNWSDGLWQITQDLQGLTQRLTDAATAYAAAEGGAQRAASQFDAAISHGPTT